MDKEPKSLLARAFNVSDELIFSIVVILVLVLIGIFAFNISWYVKGGNGLGAGIAASLRIGGKSSEGYTGLGQWYPQGDPRGPYTSRLPENRPETLVPMPKLKGEGFHAAMPIFYGQGHLKSEGMIPHPRLDDSSPRGTGVWDTDGGQMGIASTTIMGQEEKMYMGGLPSL